MFKSQLHTDFEKLCVLNHGAEPTSPPRTTINQLRVLDLSLINLKGFLVSVYISSFPRALPTSQEFPAKHCADLFFGFDFSIFTLYTSFMRKNDTERFK